MKTRRVKVEKALVNDTVTWLVSLTSGRGWELSLRLS